MGFNGYVMKAERTRGVWPIHSPNVNIVNLVFSYPPFSNRAKN